MVLRDFKDLERHSLPSVHTLPGFCGLGYVLGAVSLLHDSLGHIRRWDCMQTSTQLPEFNDTLLVRLLFPIRQFLKNQNQREWEVVN